MNEFTVSIKVSEDVAKACLKSIKPEIDSDTYGRSKVELKYDGELTLRIEAKDLHALRAAANTYLRWLDMCIKLAK
ncbi:MAG: KEOPS complex subunit Pcc1 [Candidatus Altiarchaeota archaeon]